jgi:aminopeptidase N
MSKSSAPAVETADLTWAQAKDRAARVSNVHYTLSVKLGLNEKNFEGVNKIDFDLTDNKKPLRMDFYEGEIRSLKVNGVAADIGKAKHKYDLDLPAELLKAGANSVEIGYVADYSRQGVGLHRFQDPATKEVFLYTDFEAYDANRFFPSFDQPDLRAVLDLTVEAPESWVVITNTIESSVGKAEGKRKLWKFPPTPKLATYLFALHAGPYKVWTDTYDGIPLRVLARPSLAKYVPVKDWFKYTKQGLEFYNKYFGIKYPFKKYDQIFVPEFNSGAMENVGAVTFNEGYLSRSALTRNDRRNSAGVILHEMAHMWFGDLVTMAWWNDLWLNESFATFMSSLAMAENTEFKESWQDFFADMKDWAYWEDGLVTTHPIEAPVNNVKDAFANFDGITYGKGASVLKQLNYFIGPQAFRDGIRHYLKTHSYQNTQLKDFIAALQTKTDKDLSAWADVWLRQSGTDSIAANWKCQDGKLTEIQLTQSPSPGAKFRPQSVDVGIFKMDGKGNPKRLASVRAEVTGPAQTIQGNWECPSFVYPNDNDQGFASVEIDPNSLMYLKKHLSSVKDDLVRTVIWNDLWEMVRAGKTPLKDYIEMVSEQLPKENDIIVRGKIVRTVESAVYYWPRSSTASLDERKAFIAKTEKEYLSRFQKSKPGSDDQKFWYDAYISIARTDEAMARIKKWSHVRDLGPGFPLDVDRQWDIVHHIARFEGEAAKPEVERLKKKDTSDRGVRSALAAEAIQPIPRVKEKWMETLTAPKPALSLAEARSVMGSMFPDEQRELARPYDDKFYNYVTANAKAENEMYLRSFVRSLVPVNCDQAHSARLRSYIQKQDLTPAIMKSLKVTLQEDERCQMIRAKSNL